MTARYLIRLDDALPTLHSERWQLVENLLDKYGIKPIVAVIPNNLDESMKFGVEDLFFWDRVKTWKAKGWSIGMHGFNHLYHRINKKDSLVPFHDRSEFVGLSLEEQKNKFVKASKVFSDEEVKPDLFIAPSHSFDKNTLKAMKTETSLTIVSDGIALAPFLFYDIWLIPQQLWKFKWRPFGIWTVCLHPNTITSSEIDDLAKALSKHHKKFISLDELELQEKFYNIAFGQIFSFFFWMLRPIRRSLNLIREQIKTKNQ
tara:strand:- start:469 stop:1245 length:777 start_codon:yes stop_codon:yes gene_type:complete